MSPLEEKIRVAQKRSFLFLGLGIAAAYWFSQTSPEAMFSNQISQLNQKVQATSKKVADTQEQFDNKEKFREDMEHVSQTFKLALEYLPKELNIEDILKNIYLAAHSAGVELGNFKPKETEPKDFYDELPMSISIKGTYPQIITFLAAVSKLPRIINIHDIEIFSPIFTDDDTPTMQMTGVLVGYRYKETGK